MTYRLILAMIAMARCNPQKCMTVGISCWWGMKNSREKLLPSCCASATSGDHLVGRCVIQGQVAGLPESLVLSSSAFLMF